MLIAIFNCLSNSAVCQYLSNSTTLNNPSPKYLPAIFSCLSNPATYTRLSATFKYLTNSAICMHCSGTFKNSATCKHLSSSVTFNNPSSTKYPRSNLQLPLRHNNLNSPLSDLRVTNTVTPCLMNSATPCPSNSAHIVC